MQLWINGRTAAPMAYVLMGNQTTECKRQRAREIITPTKIGVHEADEEIELGECSCL